MWKFLFFFWLVFQPVGCAHVHRFSETYSVEITNETLDNFTEADVQIRDWKMRGPTPELGKDYLDAGALASYGGVRVPIAESAVVSWRSSDGVQHTKQVSLRDVPKPPNGATLQFSIRNNDEVTLHVRLR